MTVLRTPTGKQIVATLGVILGTCYISDASQNPDGTFDIDWCGETDVCWDSQETVVRDGQRVFIDEDGREWPESELTLAEG